MANNSKNTMKTKQTNRGFSDKNNVRQLGSSDNSGTHQNQILSALDTLGAKLVRSESERETMRTLLNDALDTQEKLENQLERSQINILRRLDLMEDRNAGLNDEDRQFIEDQRRDIEDTRQEMDEQRTRQKTVEDKLRDSTQVIAKLQRRLDSQEQKRTKLQRRIERVENIAADAQNALEAKAMVLLTDQSEAYRALPHHDYNEGDTQSPFHHPNNRAPYQDNSSHSKSWISGLLTQKTIATAFFALAIGWGLATISNNPNKIFSTPQNDTVAQSVTPSIAPETIANPDVLYNNIEADIALLAATDWINDEILTEALQAMRNDEIATITAPEITSQIPPVDTAITFSDITIDHDLSLPEEIKELEAKAFDRVPEAQHDLAALYTSGQAGVSQNYDRAIVWFRQAADQGIANAAYNLGVLYQQGLGQQQDLQQALDWYRRAALLNHPEAQYNLGIAYIEGVGTRYNPAMAGAYFQRAAFAGIIEAAYNLGLILENGLLGETRPEDALVWYRAAAERGNRDAADSFKTLTANLNKNPANAGLLANGDSLSTYINPLQDIEPSAGRNSDIFAQKEVSLGSLLPDNRQMMTAQVQEQLRKEGLYTGPQDGIIGSGTISAIKRYQGDHNLAIDGIVTQTLLGYMLRQGVS